MERVLDMASIVGDALMLHELVSALLGNTGDLIIDEREYRESLCVGLPHDAPLSDEPTFSLAPDFPPVPTVDREVIEGVITLGFYYRELDRFAKFQNSNWIKSANEFPLRSEYRRALADGIFEVLSGYRSTVLQIEQKLLSDALPISRAVLGTVTQGLNKFFVLLPPLYKVILEIERDDMYGGRLLNHLHKFSHRGVPELQTCIRRLLWHGHRIMYSQLKSWMVYGILQDHCGEFFISRQEDWDSESDTAADTLENLAHMLTNDVSLTDQHHGFRISLDMLPEYVSMPVAESILFAGKAIQVLRNPSPAVQFQGAPSQQHIQTMLTGEGLLPQSEANKIESTLQNLQESSEFHKQSFETAVDTIKAIVADHLWQLVVLRADLNGHLKALKDYFLLAKDDFFQIFLEESRLLMQLPPCQQTAEAELMVLFQLASVKTIREEDKYFPRVSLGMPGITLKSSHIELPEAKPSFDGDLGVQSDTSMEMPVDGWDGITLEYCVEWPLHLFFTQEILSKYLRIFQYLLRLKRTRMELEKSCSNAMHQGHSGFSTNHDESAQSSISQQRRQHLMWRVREYMNFLIRDLQAYIQVDVIEPQWNILQVHIQNSRKFTELVGFHQEYLSALISECFLDVGSVPRILDGIMKLCWQFCCKIENEENEESTSGLEHIAEELSNKSNSLYTILHSSRIAGSRRAPFLRRFLLQLKFNSLFEGQPSTAPSPVPAAFGPKR